jgi:hypothetical protein
MAAFHPKAAIELELVGTTASEPEGDVQKNVIRMPAFLLIR